MKTFLKQALAALMLISLATVASAQSGFVPNESERAVLMRAGEIAERYLSQDDLSENIEATEQELRAVIASPGYRSARPIVRDMVLRILATTLSANLCPRARCEEVVRIANGLSERPDDNPELERADHLLLFIAGATCDEPSAARALTVLASRYPDDLASFEDLSIIQAARRLDDTATLEFLVDGRWTPSEEDTDVSILRLQLARNYVRARNLDRAGEVAQSLVVAPGASIATIVRLLVEKDFAPIIARDPQTFDFDAIMAWQLNSVATRAAAGPDQLSLQNSHARMLLVLDRKDEALALVDAALARVAAAGDAPAFNDQDEELNWTHDLRSSILQAMQSDEEALAALQQGVDAAAASGRDVVSQLLNRSADLVGLERGAEALQALQGFDPARASPYGQMVALRIRACALYQTGDIASARAVVAEMRARATDSLLQAQAAAVCTDDLDTAAALYIRMLNDPVERDRAIVGLQTFVNSEPRTAYERQQLTRVQALRARRDVSRVIDRITERRAFPIRHPAD